MPEQFTSEQFAEALESHEGRVSACVDYRAIVAAALRIASRVTGDELLDAIRTWDPAGVPSLWQHLRAKLIEESPS